MTILKHDSTLCFKCSIAHWKRRVIDTFTKEWRDMKTAQPACCVVWRSVANMSPEMCDVCHRMRITGFAVPW